MGHRMVAVDHVQLAMPPGAEDVATVFYEQLLGLDRQEKPPVLAARGGCWFSNGDVTLHLGVEEPFVPARKAHPALMVDGFDALISSLVSVRLRKRIPVGAGLGGGSSDAAAVLRWADRRDLSLAASLGADVPFCVVGGRARVGGIGEMVEPLPVEERTYLLVLPPVVVDTAAVYRAWDAGCRLEPGSATSNDLEPAALDVAPDLVHWRDALSAASGRAAHLAGSGATWFVEADEDLVGRVRAGELGEELIVRGAQAPLHLVHCVGPHHP